MAENDVFVDKDHNQQAVRNWLSDPIAADPATPAVAQQWFNEGEGRLSYQDAGQTRRVAHLEDIQESKAAASGSTLGLEQKLLASAGQPALTVLAVGPTTNGKLQGVSLGDGNVVEVYASGQDFNIGSVLYREFMSLGEPICFTNVPLGAIVSATQGFYGVTEIEGTSTGAGNQGIMPLLSYGLAFRETFLFAFRNSTGGNNDRGIIFVTNGPITNSIKLTNGSGVTVNGQEGIELTAWESTFLDTAGNQEYILSGNADMMACIISRGGGATGDTPDSATLQLGRSWDARLVLPLTSDGIVHPRSGFISAPYDDTGVLWFDRQGDQGVINNGLGVSPGSPVDIDSAVPTGTANSQTHHDPAGYTRFRATGLVTAYSGADGQGGDAAPMKAVSSMSQVIAQPFFIPDSGLNDESSITVFGPYEGSARVYSWNGTGLTLEYTLPVTRDAGVTISSRQDQLHPCAASLGNDGSLTNNTLLVGALSPGVIISDVPIGAIVQAQGDTVSTLRSQNGTTTVGVYSQEDETLMYGWTPDELRAEVTEGTDGILYKRVVAAGGVESWVPA